MPRRPRRNPLIASILRDFDEFSHFPSDDARRRAVEAHLKAAERPRDWLIGVAILVASVIAAAYSIRTWLIPALPGGTPPIVIDLVRFGGVFAVFGVAFVFLHRWGAREALRKRLLAEGVAVCLKCGYLLRGLPPDTDRCPECGRRPSHRARALLAAPPTWPPGEAE